MTTERTRTAELQALTRFGRHLDACKLGLYGSPCTCGFAEAVAALASRQGAAPEQYVSNAEAHELADILRTLTPSGTALVTSARDLRDRYLELKDAPRQGAAPTPEQGICSKHHYSFAEYETSCPYCVADAALSRPAPTPHEMTQAGNDFAAGIISAGKLAEVLGVDDTRGFKTQAHAFCDRDEQDAAPTLPSPWTRPKIICLSGSTRFIETFAIKTWELEREGNIVLGCTLLPQWYCDVPSHFGERTGTKAQCDELHLRKIDMADEVLVLNVEGYIGESTRNEIAYAESCGKPVRYLELLPPTPETPGGPR